MEMNDALPSNLKRLCQGTDEVEVAGGHEFLSKGVIFCNIILQILM